MENELALTEKMLLLAIRPEKGGISVFLSNELDFSLMGGLLLELTLTKNAEIKDKRIEALSVSHNSPLYSYMLEKLAKSPHPRKIGHWLNPFSFSKKKVRTAIYDSLARKREIRLEERHFLFFKWKKPFLMPGNHVFNLIDKIKSMISQEPVLPEDLYLLTLLEPAHLLQRIYPERSMRKKARLRIKGFQSGNLTSGAMRQAIETAGVVKAAVIAAIAASRASHSG